MLRLKTLITLVLVWFMVSVCLYAETEELVLVEEVEEQVEALSVDLGNNVRVIVNREVNVKTCKGNRKRTGYGGGTWMPIWFTLDMGDVNELIANIDRNIKTFEDDGLLYTGGGGKIAVGRGLFIGGMGASRRVERSFNISDTDTNSFGKIEYRSRFGGVTIDKRFALSSKFIVSPGLMLGRGSHRLAITTTDGEFNWNEPLATNSQNYEYRKSFLIVQPRLEAMYRLLGWLAIRGEVGYIYGHSMNKGWQALHADNTYDVHGSPDTGFEGFTFSLGPWFGF